MRSHAHYDKRAPRVDFSSAALYLPAIQVICALLLSCLTTLAIAYFFSDTKSNALRAAVLSGIVSFVVVFKPVRVDECVGMDLIFDTVRPAVWTYWIAIVCQQMLHSCIDELDAPRIANISPAPVRPTFQPSTGKTVLFHVMVLAAMTAGFGRAYRPTSQQDLPFLVSSLCFLVIAMLPPHPKIELGPLCHVENAWDAGERVVRAVLFGVVFCALAYASEPARYSIGEITLCSARATAASAWILACVPMLLVLAPVQAGLAVFRRFRDAYAPVDEAHMHLASIHGSDDDRSLHEEDSYPNSFCKDVVLNRPSEHDAAASQMRPPVSALGSAHPVAPTSRFASGPLRASFNAAEFEGFPRTVYPPAASIDAACNHTFCQDGFSRASVPAPTTPSSSIGASQAQEGCAGSTSSGVGMNGNAGGVSPLLASTQSSLKCANVNTLSATSASSRRSTINLTFHSHDLSHLDVCATDGTASEHEFHNSTNSMMPSKERLHEISSM
jgi:hypothetical protein